ncbi:unnamed protein product, partial [Sphacelaria rigidula]
VALLSSAEFAVPCAGSLDVNRKPRLLVVSRMESLLKIADDLHDGLRQVKPSLTIQQHEQINDLLLSEDGFLLQALHLSVDMSESKLDDSCRQLSGRLTMDVASPASWAGFVVQALSRLLAKGEYDKVQFIYHIWHVALAAEETHDGVG